MAKNATKEVKKLYRLLLVRKASARSTLLDRMGASKFLEGEPINVSPRTWPDEAGVSHYGYRLKDISLKELQELEKWIADNDPEAITFHSYDSEANEPLTEALNSVGLRVNEAVE